MNVYLESTAGPEKGRSLQLSDNQVLQIGRSEKADVALALDQSISSLHFALSCDGESCRIQDLKSRNGTFVNGRPVTDAVLKSGDEIRVGNTTFMVSIVSSVVAPLPASAAQPSTKPSRIARSPRRFYIELYEEHLEETSFLYAQRLTLFDDREITWITIGEWEERLEAHLDALVIGEDLALEVCEKQAAEGDFGVLFAVVSVFCRQRRLDLLTKVLNAVPPDDLEKLQAVADALKYECPSEWTAEIAQVLPDKDPRLLFMLATIHGYRRVKGEQGSVWDIDILAPVTIKTLSWSLGRVGQKTAKPQLQTWLRHEDGAVRSAVALALLRLGEHKLVHDATLHGGLSAAPWSVRAIASTSKELTQLLTQVSRHKPEPYSLMALGLMGDIASVPVLLSHMTDEVLAPAAALGLNTITGAELYEKVFIPEVMEEDELFDEEKEQVKKGQPVLRPDGKPYGENVVRLSQKPDAWNAWWASNQNRFSPGLRYRGGVPLTPMVLVDTMAFAKTPRTVRQLTYEELVVRYGIDIPFETDMPVRQQQDAIGKWKSWAMANEGRFKPGAWYVYGQVVG